MRFVVTSGLDSVDFTAAALVAVLRPQETTYVIVDGSLEAEGSGNSFDPSLSVPVPTFGRSADGSVRQVMRSPLPDDDPSESRSLSAARFIEECFRNLGIRNVQVNIRADRTLRATKQQAALAAIASSPALEDGAWHRFRQGGGIQVSGQTRIFRDLGQVAGEACVGPRPPIPLQTLAGDHTGIVLRGPLDALGFGSSTEVMALHVPWYADTMPPSEWPHGPRACVIVTSLFRRFPGSAPLEPETFGGVLLSEYVDTDVVGLGACSTWLPAVAQWISVHGPSAKARWAATQAGARQTRDLAKGGAIPDPPASPLLGLVELARDAAELARARHDDRSPVDPQGPISSVITRSQAAFAEWHLVLETLRLPADLTNGSRYSLLDIRQRAGQLPLDNAGRHIAGLRILLWEAVDLAIRACMLVADTLLRASVPALALYDLGPALHDVVREHRDLLEARLADIRTIAVI